MHVTLHGMTDGFTSWALRRGGFFTRAEAKDYGYSDSEIQAAGREGRWLRLRHGYYSFADHVAGLYPAERHALLGRAVMHRLGSDYALVGVSACAAHRLDLWDAQLDIVRVARLDGRTGRTEAGIKYQRFRLDPTHDVVSVGDVVATRVDRAVWEASTELSTEAALVCMNSALHRSAVTDEDLDKAGADFAFWPGSRTARLAHRLSDPRIETVGESRTFFLCWEYGLPCPQPQYEVINADGALVARTDFAWLKYRHVCEFDGKVKYLRYVRPGESPSDTVLREKRREDLVRAERLGMSRVIWPDIQGAQRPRTAYGLRTGLDRSHQLYARSRTVIALG